MTGVYVFAAFRPGKPAIASLRRLVLTLHVAIQRLPFAVMLFTIRAVVPDRVMVPNRVRGNEGCRWSVTGSLG
jgi:hypothetical protein